MEFLKLLVIALTISSIGFHKFIYFISLGYGFSIAGLGGWLLIGSHGRVSGVMLVACMLLIIYGFRLGGYLMVREARSTTYRDLMKKEIKDGSGMKLAVKIAIWVSCSLLYVLQISPMFFRLQNGGGVDGLTYLGVLVMIGGLVIESVADMQKSIAKRKSPNRFCDEGLYSLVRCPNYFGEILFWTGVLISGIGALDGIWQWIMALVGWICIVYIMFGGARRLEMRQNRNYGADLEYQRYVRNTPIIIPFLPLYSVEKYKWLKG